MTDQSGVQGLVIEFLGLPGAGKTTLTTKLTPLLQELGIAIHEPSFKRRNGKSGKRILVKLHMVITELIFHFRFTLLSICYILMSKQTSWRDTFTTCFNWLFCAGIIRQNSLHTKPILLDQGIFQALWSIRYSCLYEPVSLELLLNSLICMPFIVVVLNTDPTIIRKRLHERPGSSSRLEKKLEQGDNVELTFQRAITSFEKTKETLKKCAKINRNLLIIEIGEEELDLDLNALTISQVIERLYASSPYVEGSIPDGQTIV
ncbi:hypothetical protein [Brevibacillus sp. SYSU BS000544]|uniref:hypothetical protein n=1 Tax=Brevibacillus sp. SYSU BS000544 TaxID=3416443 RepID=UPI003CE4F9EA